MRAAAMLSPNAIEAAMPGITSILISNAINFIAAIVILIIGWTTAMYVRRWIRSAFAKYNKILDPSLGPVFAAVARYAILILTVIAVLERFGVAMTSLIAVIGAAGIAIGLALQGTLSNVAAGMMILLLRPFRAGDMISILGSDGTRGIVKEIGLFRTLVTSVEYKSLSFPNATIFAGTIVNYSQEERYRLDIPVPVDWKNDLGEVRRVFLDEVNRNTRIFKTPPPIIGISELGDYSATILVRVWVDYSDRNTVSWEIRQALHERMRTEGIAMPVPRQASSSRSETDLPPEITGVPAPTALVARDTTSSGQVNRIRPAE
jgi:small conductance mechanosensitive channel